MPRIKKLVSLRRMLIEDLFAPREEFSEEVTEVEKSAEGKSFRERHHCSGNSKHNHFPPSVVARLSIPFCDRGHIFCAHMRLHWLFHYLHLPT